MQSTTSAPNAAPDASENTSSAKHASEVSPTTVNAVRTPLPAGIVPPVKLNPITTPGLFDTVKPACSAAPPPAPVTSTPSTLNWKPAIAVSVSYNTFTVPPGWSGQSAKSHSTEPVSYTHLTLPTIYSV